MMQNCVDTQWHQCKCSSKCLYDAIFFATVECAMCVWIVWQGFKNFYLAVWRKTSWDQSGWFSLQFVVLANCVGVSVYHTEMCWLRAPGFFRLFVSVRKHSSIGRHGTRSTAPPPSRAQHPCVRFFLPSCAGPRDRHGCFKTWHGQLPWVRWYDLW